LYPVGALKSRMDHTIPPSRQFLLTPAYLCTALMYRTYVPHLCTALMYRTYVPLLSQQSFSEKAFDYMTYFGFLLIIDCPEPHSTLKRLRSVLKRFSKMVRFDHGT